jgi:predicted nucleic acid-binding protein
MKSVFADTFFYLALLDERDEHHPQVLSYLQHSRDFVLTTRWVFAEVANAMSGSVLRADVVDLLMTLESDPSVIVVGTSDELYRRGLELYANSPDKEWSLTDCISFVVMKEHAVQEALTGDHHFTQAGFQILLGD